jgi:rod shape-determining protein MreC
MTEFRTRLLVSSLAVGLVGIAVVSMVSDRRAILSGRRELPAWSSAVLDVAVPVQKAIAVPVELVRDAWGRYLALIGVEGENRQLRSRLAQVEEENLQLREALVASGRLGRIAEMREEFEIPMLPAELVGVDASPWFRSVLIDRGRSHGLRAGMPVISELGLAGLVTATSADAAKAMLLLDRQSAVDGVVQRSRSRGMVRGVGAEHLEFEFVAREADVRVGDLVITSGLGGVYPKGLRVGEITAISEPGPQLLRKATLSPAVDFGRLEQIFVMLRRGPAMELLYAADDAERQAVASLPSSPVPPASPAAPAKTAP